MLRWNPAMVRFSSPLRVIYASLIMASATALPLPAQTVVRPAAETNELSPQVSEVRVGLLLARLHDADWILRWQAMEELVALKVAAAGGPLRGIVADSGEHPWVRSRALVAMARLGVQGSLELSMSLADDASPQLRAGAVEALGLLGHAGGSRIAKERIVDADPSVCSAALVAYARIARAEAWEAVKAAFDGDLREAAFRAVVHIPAPAAQQKIQLLLDSDDVNSRRRIMKAIGESRDPRFIPALLARLAVETDADSRLVGEQALAKFDDALLAEPLLQVLASDKSPLYQVALKLLARRVSKPVCDVVVANLVRIETADPRALAAALDLLSRFDGDAFRDVAARHLKHPLAEVRCSAIVALSRSRQADHFSMLQDALIDPEPMVRAAAFQSLRRNTRGVPKGGITAYLAKPLLAKDPLIVREAMALLRDRLTRAELQAAMAALEPHLTGSDPEIQQAAARALAAVADDEATARVAIARGFLTPWLLIGPFNFEPTEGSPSALSAVFPPEKEFDANARYEAGRGDRVSWSVCRSRAEDSTVDLGYVYGGRRRSLRAGQHVAYALVDVVSTEERSAQLRLGIKGEVAVWLNGTKLPKAQDSAAGPTIAVQLAKGNNRLLLKLAAGDGREWSYRAQILGQDGRPISGLKTVLPASGEESPQ